MRKSQQKHLEEALRACASSLPDDGPCDGVEENEAEYREAAPLWPAQVEDFRVPDDVCAAAYEAALPQCRAAIKTGLALGMAHYEQERPSGGHCRRERRDARLGYWQSSGRHPAPWAILAFSPSYAAAARLAAVALCAQLAEIPLLGAVCVGGMPSGPVLTALELCGVEDIFCMDPADLCALLEELPAPGRLALLHAGELDGIDIRRTRRAHAGGAAAGTFRRSRAPLLSWRRRRGAGPAAGSGTPRSHFHGGCLGARPQQGAGRRPLPQRRRSSGTPEPFPRLRRALAACRSFSRLLFRFPARLRTAAAQGLRFHEKNAQYRHYCPH